MPLCTVHCAVLVRNQWLKHAKQKSKDLIIMSVERKGIAVENWCKGSNMPFHWILLVWWMKNEWPGAVGDFPWLVINAFSFCQFSGVARWESGTSWPTVTASTEVISKKAEKYRRGTKTKAVNRGAHRLSKIGRTWGVWWEPESSLDPKMTKHNF